MAIEIREHIPGKDTAPFIRAADVVFEGDPAWCPPLNMEIGDRLSPAKNPFFKRGEAALFTAWKDGRCVGRCSASIDREWLRMWKDETGFFGFFDTIDDEEVARALLDRAEAWLRDKGMKRVMGPAGLYMNEEVGILVDGFEHPPMLSMGHSRAWQGKLVEAAGYAKEKDLYAWRYDANTGFNARTTKAWESIQALPEVKLRTFDMSRMREELGVVLDIYNEAWAGKWGFIPVLPDELDKMVEDMKMVLDPDIAFIAEIDGKPIGMCIMVPNLNEAIHDLGGSLFPFGWAKLLWRIKMKHPVTTRLILLGIRSAVRKNHKRYGGLSAAMYVEVAKRGIAKGYQWSELGWTREDDAPINLGIKSMGAKVYKTYRVYTKAL
jgi:hypothetical protein